MTSFLLFLLVLSCVQNASLAEGESYVAEGYFVVDDKTVQAYIANIQGTDTLDVKRTKAMAELKKDIDYMLNEMNQMFTSLLTNGVNLEVRQRQLDILSSDVFPTTSMITSIPNAISAETALKLFDDWLLARSSYTNLKYDFAFLWTGYDLYGSAGSYTAGYAHVGKMCDSKSSTGVGEFSRTYLTALTTAHEIGHILGSEHGGPASSNIMASLVDSTDVNRWSFSSCSASDIKEYIASLSSNCLLTTDPASTKPTITYGTYTGLMLDTDAICQRSLNNPKSYMCKLWSLYNNMAPSGDRVCSQIYCSMPGTQYCSSAYASDGMICDASMRCKTGKCMPDSTAPASIDSKCVYGDQKLELQSLGFYNTCDVYLKNYSSSYCYQDSINQRCCNACKAYYTGRTGCEYGDKTSECIKYSKKDICPQYKDTLCCGYCFGYVSKRTQDQDTQSNVPNLNLPTVIQDQVLAIQDHGKTYGQE